MITLVSTPKCLATPITLSMSYIPEREGSVTTSAVSTPLQEAITGHPISEARQLLYSRNFFLQLYPLPFLLLQKQVYLNSPEQSQVLHVQAVITVLPVPPLPLITNLSLILSTHSYNFTAAFCAAKTKGYIVGALVR